MEKRQTKMLEGNLKMLTEKYPQILLMDASGGQEAASFLQDISDKGLADCSCFGLYNMEKQGMQEAKNIATVAVIPFGRTYREKITDEIDYVRLHGGKVVAAVLTRADGKWSMIYYAQRCIKKAAADA